MKTKRSRRTLLVIGLLVIALIAVQIVYACEPCPSVLTFEETAAEADLIIIGEKASNGPSTGDGPDWIMVDIYEVLKGSADETRIQVNSWDGMCPYGIVIDEGRYVMFLEEHAEEYDSVNWGCSVTTYPVDVEGDIVLTEEGVIPIDRFVESLGPEASRTIIEQPGGGLPSLGLAEVGIISGVGLCLAVSAVVAVAAVIVVSRRRGRSE